MEEKINKEFEDFQKELKTREKKLKLLVHFDLDENLDEALKELKEKTGLDKDVQDYILSFPQSQDFADRFADLIKYLIPQYIKEGKSYLTIAIGCTGGKHRSVFMAHQLAETLRELGLSASEFHRDIELW